MSFGFGFGFPRNYVAALFTPAQLFTAGVNGTWYDPSDINLTWRRNLLTYSEQFDNAAWVKLGATVTANTELSPDGVLSTDLIKEDTSTGLHLVYSAVPVTAGTSYTLSYWVKRAVGSRNIAMRLDNGDGVSRRSIIDLSTGAISANAAHTVTARLVGSYWYVTCTMSAAVTTSIVAGAELNFAGVGSSYTGDGTSGIYIWGAQLELGSTATPYQRITDGIKDYLDYNPLPILYQDAAGTTPVTAVGQPVGLMLDKSKGLVLGSELEPNNGTFSSAAGWVTGPGTSISGGVATSTSVTSGTILVTPSTDIGVINKWYQVTISVSSITSGGIRPVLFGNILTSNVITLAGTYTFKVLASSATGYVQAYGSSSTSCVLSAFSVRELPGNHAFNSSGNSANFPVLSARYNLLTKSEDFSDAVWVKSNISLASGVADSIGGNSAFTLTATSNFGSISQSGVRVGTFVSSIWIRRRYGSGGVQILSADGNTWVSVTVTSQWTRFTDIKTSTNLGGTGVRLSVSGDAVDIAFADLRVTNDALNQPAYQRVNTSTDYDTVGFKPYLSFNGVNQWLQTNSIDFTYGDKMFVCAGVRKLSDATGGFGAQLCGTRNATQPGTFEILSPSSTLGTYYLSSGGSLRSAAESSATYPAPTTNVISGIGNISGDQAILRVNGTQAAISTADQGTGNYGNYPLYIGARAGSSLWFNGRLYGLVVAGKQASASEIANTEAWLNNKTGAY